MAREAIVGGDLLYHSVHGLCRVDRLIEQTQAGKKVMCYSVVPKVVSKMKVRYIIGKDDIEASGFHTLVSPKEANRILDFFKAGNHEAAPNEQNGSWDLARNILSFSQDTIEVKDQRKRQALDRSVKGLLGELAFVFNATLKETAARVRRSLGNSLKIHPLVSAALVHAVEDY